VQIALHEQGTNAGAQYGKIAGRFSIDVALAPSGHSGAGGLWAAFLDGYGTAQPYSVEWDGTVAR